MKTLFCFIGLLLAVIVRAQTPQLPTGKPKLPAGKPQLPAPKISTVITKPDLIITNVSLVSATGWTDRWEVKLSVTIKNNGSMAAPASVIKAMVQDAGAPSNPWKSFVDLPAIGVINPNQSVTTEIRFLDKAWIMHKIKTINLKLQADARNTVAESNETNNESSIIRITSN